MMLSKNFVVMYILDDDEHDYFGFKYFIARYDAGFNFGWTLCSSDFIQISNAHGRVLKNVVAIWHHYMI